MNHTLKKGFSLIEILVSLVLVAMILLGLEGLGFFALQQETEAAHLSIAVNQLNNLSERLRALGTFEGLKNQITEWNKENKIVLPQGKGRVTGTFPDYTITINWMDKTCKNTPCFLQEKIHL